MSTPNKALTYVEADLDKCSLTYGVPPCRAHLGFAGQSNPTIIQFDGTSAYLTRGANLSGVADAKVGSLSCWLNVEGADGADEYIFSTTNEHFVFFREAANLLQLRAADSGGTVILLARSVMSVVQATGWVHVLASWDLAAGTIQMYLNDAANISVTTNTNATIDYTDTDFSVGALPGGTVKFAGRMAELWIDTTTRIDFSNVANRRKFIDASGGRPVFLGDAGDVPTGSSPAVFLSGAASGWYTNKGTGGGFVLHGILADTLFGIRKCFNTLATCQDRLNFTNVPQTIRFTMPTDHRPKDIDAFPFIDTVEMTPATISLGESLGERATLTITMRDRPDSDTNPATGDKYRTERGYDPFTRGTFFGKMRARHKYVRGRPCRYILGMSDQALADMETRYFVLESFDGPSHDGVYTLVAQDVLKLADDDRSQAPLLSEGFIVASITNVATSATLSPSGIGVLYPASGYLNLGGKEIVSFTRSSDALTIVRGQLGTAAVAHDAQERAQLVLTYSAQRASAIIYDLLVNYAGIDASFIDLPTWTAEDAAFNGQVYTGVLANPMGVNSIVTELVEQAGLAVWWDDLAQEIGFQILRGVITSPLALSDANILKDSFAVKEQPDKRLSEVWTFFAQKNPLTSLEDESNYKSSVLTLDGQRESDYGSPAIKKIYSRWIPDLGRAVAQHLNAIILARYKDPPRLFSFDLIRRAGTDPGLAETYGLQWWCLQDDTGGRDTARAQITRLEARAEMYHVEAEEALFDPSGTAGGGELDLTTRYLFVDADTFDLNLRTAHDLLYPPLTGTETIEAIVTAGVKVGSNGGSSGKSFNVGSWPEAGVTINVRVRGRIEGAGGSGGSVHLGGGGGNGGTALYTRRAINLFLDVGAGEIWGGGGGGNAIHTPGPPVKDYGGGGGAGQLPGPKGVGYLEGGGSGNPDGYPGTTEAGGRGAYTPGTAPLFPEFQQAGDGGGPGLPGQHFGSGSAAGTAGVAIDGVSYCAITGAGDRRGPQIN